MQLSKEQQVLLNLIAMSISDNPDSLILSNEDLTGVNFITVAKESIFQAVNIQAYSQAYRYKDCVTEPVLNKWEEYAVSLTMSNLNVLTQQNELVQILNESGYKYAIIKGTSSSTYYKNPSQRALGDVDFLIKREDKDAIEKLLVEKGYEKDAMAHSSHVIFKKPGAHLEMHFEIAGLPDNEYRDLIRKFVEPTVETAVEKELESSKFLSPISTYHGLIIILHTQHHMQADGLGLRHLCDFAVFVSKTHKEEFWQKDLLPLLKKIGLYKFLCVMVNACVNYLKIPKPDWVIDFVEPTAKDVMLDVFTGGNLGKKDNVRSRSGMLIAQKGRKKRGALATLAVSLHKAVLLKYPIVKKWWILYPFVYTYKAIQNVLRMIFGKRVSITQMAPEAKKRQNLYDKLEIYKTHTEDE